MQRAVWLALGMTLVGCPRERATEGEGDPKPTATGAVDPANTPPPRGDVARYHLRKQGLTDAAFEKWLASLPPPDALTSLDVRDNELTAAAMDAIDKSKLGMIEELMLSRNPLGDAGGRSIANGKKFTNTRILWMDRTKLGSDGVKSLLGKTSKLAGPNELNLSENPIGDDGVEALAASERCESLSALYLTKTGMGDRGAKALAASTHLSKLERLDISGNAVSGDVIAKLKASPGLSGAEIVAGP
jgi:hypothetical protein